MQRLGALITGFLSLLTGMTITLRTMLRTLIGKPVTLQYPHEEPVLSPNYRSAIRSEGSRSRVRVQKDCFGP